MLLYFIRHGETAWNQQRRFQGRTDILLNENGRQVAEWTREGLQDVSFDVAFTSPLIRAKETAQIVLGDRTVELIEDERLIEMSFGSYEGTYAREQDENLRNFFVKPEAYLAPDDGETIQDILHRTKAFLEDLFANSKYANSTVLISTHGATLSGLLCAIKGWQIPDFWKGGLHKNCGLSIVEVKDGTAHILEEAILMYDENQTK